MTTTIKNYTPSINIIRDFDKALDYVPTPNAQLVFNQLTNDYLLGIRSFNIIGAYGTGKSSFLWAFDKVINRKKDYFTINSYFQDFEGFETVNIIGDYNSIIDTFAYHFNLKNDYTATSILQAIDKFYKKQAKKKKGLILFIDEFGKFLEYAAKNKPDQELYFIQQLAEYVNDKDKDICVITSLHQGFTSYSFGLTKNQQNEWSKVKGRLKDIAFNEPVEQLLYLASERLDLQSSKKDASFNKLFKGIKHSKAFPLRDYLNEEIAEKLLPLDILSAALLTLALQKYGQNERSLFSFLDSNDLYGIKNFKKNTPYYSISSVYEYLNHNFLILATRHNPHQAQWAAIRIAIERVEGLFDVDLEEAKKIVHTIGLLNIFSTASARIDDDFLAIYGKYSLGIKKPVKILERLEQFKIIRYVRHKRKYVLFEGTDLDIEVAIDEAGNLVERVTHVLDYLNTYFEFPYILAKAVFYKYGTPRFFEFRLSEEPIDEQPKGEIDGFINLVFSETVKIAAVKTISKKSNKAILYGVYNKTNKIKNLIFEIEKIKKVIERNPDDKVAKRELDSILNHQIKLLNHYVLGAIYKDSDSIKWYFNGEKITFNNQKELNRILSHICETIYHKTPVFKTEFVNKTKLSTQILTARKKLIRQVVNHWQEENIGFEDTTFPPQKTIFLSLLKETGIVQKLEDGTASLGQPTDVSFSGLWDVCDAFLDGAKSGKRNIVEFKDILLAPPFKLKKGFLDFWLPLYLFIKREDYALFEKNIYIPNVSDQVLEILVKNPQKYYVKAFDISGVNLSLFKLYRELLGQKEAIPSNQSFIETIKPFLVFYKTLPTYAKNTKRLRAQALKLRTAIEKAEEPEKTFFEVFPNALGYNKVALSGNVELLDDYIEDLRLGIRELRGAYGALQDRFENCICGFLSLEVVNFKAYQTILTQRFQNLKEHYLQQSQKVFLQRIKSDLDRQHWLDAVCQACVGKTLQNISDKEEPLLFDRFVEIVKDLDNLYELAKVKEHNETDEIVSIELLSIGKPKKKRIVRMPVNKNPKVKIQLNKIERTLGDDKEVNIAALTKLLNEFLNHE